MNYRTICHQASDEFSNLVEDLGNQLKSAFSGFYNKALEPGVFEACEDFANSVVFVVLKEARIARQFNIKPTSGKAPQFKARLEERAREIGHKQFPEAPSDLKWLSGLSLAREDIEKNQPTLEDGWRQARLNWLRACERIVIFHLLSEIRAAFEPPAPRGSEREQTLQRIHKALHHLRHRAQSAQDQFALLLGGEYAEDSRVRILASLKHYSVMEYLSLDGELPGSYPASAEASFRASAAQHGAQHNAEATFQKSHSEKTDER